MLCAKPSGRHIVNDDKIPGVVRDVHANNARNIRLQWIPRLGSHQRVYGQFPPVHWWTLQKHPKRWQFNLSSDVHRQFPPAH